jgi:hypothetical protein
VCCTQSNARYRKILTICLEYTVVSSDHRKGRVAVWYTQYVAAMMQCTNDRKMTTTYIVHTMVSLYHRMIVEACRNNLCDFTIPGCHFTQQYTVCAPAGSVSSV